MKEIENYFLYLKFSCSMFIIGYQLILIYINKNDKSPNIITRANYKHEGFELWLKTQKIDAWINTVCGSHLIQVGFDLFML